VITETLARSLTLEELATRLESHDDIAVRVFIEKYNASDVVYLQERLDAFETWISERPK